MCATGCGREGTSVDHDHACCAGKRSCGKCVRGWLCRGCNIAAGHLRDDPTNARRLADYLERTRIERTSS